MCDHSLSAASFAFWARASYAVSGCLYALTNLSPFTRSIVLTRHDERPLYGVFVAVFRVIGNRGSASGVLPLSDDGLTLAVTLKQVI